MKKSISIRTQFAFIFAFLIALLSLLLSILIGVQSSKILKKEIGSSLSEISSQMSGKLEQYMWGRSGEIEVLKNLESLKNPDDLDEIQATLDTLKYTFPSFSWVGFLDSNGVVKASTDNILKGVDISERPVFLEGIKGKFIGDVHDAVLLSDLLPNPTGEMMKFVDISGAVYGEDGEVQGVLAAHLSWDWAKEIEKTFMEPLYKRTDLELFIISDKDNSVLLGPEDLIGERVNLNSVKSADTKKSGWVVEDWLDGKEYLTGYSKGEGHLNYEGLNWTVLVRQPSKVAYGATQTLQIYILVIGGALTVCFAFIGWLMSGRIVKPLHKINEAANDIINGKNTLIPTFEGIKDIEVLSHSLRELVTTLTHTENSLVEMKNIANHDALTGLPNRVALNLYIKDIISSNKHNDQTISILYLDLDGFKRVNDSLGHDAGDEVLRETATRITKNIRDTELVVRLGGDEFLVIVFTSLGSFKQEVKIIASRIIKDLNKEFLVCDDVVKIGCSIGASIWPIDTDDLEEAIILADKALYESKKLDKNCLTFYSDLI